MVERCSSQAKWMQRIGKSFDIVRAGTTGVYWAPFLKSKRGFRLVTL